MADFLSHPPLGPRILIYHQVGSYHGHQMEVSLGNFTRQIEWLRERRHVVDLETALDRWEEPGSADLVVLTFDDGYQDLFTTAFPILSEAGMPFTLYLTTGGVGDRSDEPMRASEQLTWGNLEQMLESGLMTLGAHTHTHPDLRSLSMAEIQRELSISDTAISDKLGVVPRHFAYPYGFWSEGADRLVRENYTTAVLGGSPRPSKCPEPQVLHRYPVQLSDGFLYFKARLKRGLRAEEAVRRRLKGYKGP